MLDIGLRRLRAPNLLAAISLPVLPMLSPNAVQHSPSFALQKYMGCTYQTHPTFGFKPNSGLSDPQKDLIRDGFAAWSQVKDLDGYSFVAFHEVMPTGTDLPAGAVAVRVGTNGRDSGNTSCSGDMWLDPSGITTTDKFRAVATHEGGHWIGMVHPGDDDGTPVMRTCLGALPTSSDPGLDDDAQVYYRAVTTSTTADPGFERVEPYPFWVGSGASVIAGGRQGTHEARLAGNGSYLQQTHVVQTLGTSRNWHVKFSFKMAGGTTGPANYKLYRTPMTYPGGSTCQFVGGLNFNNPTYGNEVLDFNVNTVNSVNWFDLYSSTDTFGAFDAYKLRLRLTNGSTGDVFIDNAYVQAL